VRSTSISAIVSYSACRMTRQNDRTTDRSHYSTGAGRLVIRLNDKACFHNCLYYKTCRPPTSNHMHQAQHSVYSQVSLNHIQLGTHKQRTDKKSPPAWDAYCINNGPTLNHLQLGTHKQRTDTDSEHV